MKVIVTAFGAGVLIALGSIAVFMGAFLFSAFDLVDYLRSTARTEAGVPIFKGRRDE